MNDLSPYAPPQASPNDPIQGDAPPTVGLILGVGAAIAGMLNLGAAMRLAEAKGGAGPEASGLVLGTVVLLPLLFIGLSQVIKSNRTWRTRVKVFFYASIVLWLGSLGQLRNLTESTGI